MFDSYTYGKKLKAAGFTDEQVEVLVVGQVQLILEELATKDDLQRLEANLRGEMVALRGEVHTLAAELRGEMTGLRGEMQTLGAKLSGEMRLLRWMLGVTVAGVISLVIWLIVRPLILL